MNSYGLFVCIILLLIAPFVVWTVATKHPSQIVKDKIKRDSIRDELSKWYTARKWQCIDIIDDYPGFMGMPTCAIVLQSDQERIRLVRRNSKIVKGVHVNLRSRTDDEMRSGVWISAVDEFMIPCLILA